MRPRLKEATFKKLSFEESSNLETPFSLAEIKEVIYTTCDKIPRPYGFNMDFYKAA